VEEATESQEAEEVNGPEIDIVGRQQPLKRRQGNKGKEIVRKSASTVTSDKKNNRKRNLDADEKEKEKKPSLRELTAQAYSRSSLHTFKSNYTHRNQAENSSRGKGRGRIQSSHRSRGRGQPDMRLRMNAMLEKIKKDLA
jgi:hypothetical protein